MDTTRITPPMSASASPAPRRTLVLRRTATRVLRVRSGVRTGAAAVPLDGTSSITIVPAP